MCNEKSGENLFKVKFVLKKLEIVSLIVSNSLFCGILIT